MNVEELIARCLEAKISLTLASDNPSEAGIDIHAEDGALTPELIALLKQHKADLVQWLKRKNQNEQVLPEITKAERQDLMPLSFSQQKLWLIDRLTDAGYTYNMSGSFRIDGVLDKAAVDKTFAEIIRRQDSFRTSFHEVNGQQLQRIAQTVDFQVEFIAVKPEQLDRFVVDHAHQVFDLTRAPLLTVKVFEMSENERVMSVSMHHIICDGWSLSILMREFNQIYGAFSQGHAPALPELPVQYADYACWQRKWLQGEILDQQLDYWSTQLANLPMVHSLPLDRARPQIQTFVGKTYRTQINAATTQGLNKLCQTRGATLFMGLHAAFSVLLSRHSNEKDIVVGSPIANREQVEIADLVGFFVNTLVLRSDLSDDPNFFTLLERSKQTLLEAYAHQQVPFEQLVERLQSERSLSHSPLFQIMLVLQNNRQVALDLPGLTFSAVEESDGIAKFDLTLYMTENSNGLQMDWEYNTDLFEEATIVRLAQHFERLLESLLNTPEVSVLASDMLTDAERRQLLVEWNNTAAEYPRDLCIHELFEIQVEQNPVALAVVCDGQQLTYEELNLQANQLAHYLINERQVAPGSLVGVCVDPSLHMVVGILAILKAGGAYVPLDPNYPEARLTYMLEDSALSTVLTHSHLHKHLQKKITLADQQAVNLNDETLRATLATYSTKAPHKQALGLTARHPAYVIYTSGSTGKPKGVRGSHRSIVNRICWMNQHVPASDKDVFCQKTSIVFVDHVAEIFQPFSVGKHLVIVNNEDAKDAESLVQTIQKYGITRITVVPSLLKTLLNDVPAITQFTSLRCVVSSGEALTLDVAKQFRKVLPDVRLFNIYGSTEVGADVLCYELDSSDLDIGVLRYFLDESAEDAGLEATATVRKDKPTSIVPGLGANIDSLRQRYNDSSMPDSPKPLEEYLLELDKNVIPGMVNVASRTFVGHMTSKLPNFIPEIGRIIAEMNQNVVKIETSGSMSLIERQVISMMHRLFFNLDEAFYETHCQDPMHVFGLATSGGSLSNITALLYARNKGLIKLGASKEDLVKQGFSALLEQHGFKKAVVLGTGLLHYSMRKAISLFGIGESSLIQIEQDEHQRMSVAHLEKVIKECREQNHYIIAVIGIAGATETGTVDPLHAIASVTQRYDVHFHVDAAWGGAFQFSDKHQHKLRGIEQADTITLCPHKQLYLPQGISLCLLRDTTAISAITTHANYQAQPGSFDMGQYTLEGSRPANTLFLHASLNLISKKGYGWLVDQSMDKTAYFVKLIESANCFELVGAKPDLNIINYRYIPQALRAKSPSYHPEDIDLLNDAVDIIQREQFKAGRTFVSKTTLFPGGVAARVFRVVLSNPLTTYQSLREVLVDQMTIAAQHIERCADHSEINSFSTDFDVEVGAYDKWMVPVGKPLANSRVFLLDSALNPVPIGVVGELYVAGDCLALDYLNKPELTDEKFIANPFTVKSVAFNPLAFNSFDGDEDTRLYKTGDLMRWRPDGNLEYVGRLDHQVKVRGFRIELGEIESALTAHCDVKDAIVAAKDYASGDTRLVAYLVADDAAFDKYADNAALLDQLRQHLTRILPDYMVPAAFVVLDCLPLNPNGKVDRKALPEPDVTAQQAVYVPPATDTARLLCEVWQEVLGVPRVGATDNFFQLGGNSLLITGVVQKLKAKGCYIDVRSFYRNPELRSLADDYDSKKAQNICEPNRPVYATGEFYAPPPNRLWYFKRTKDLLGWGRSALFLLPDPDDHSTAIQQATEYVLEKHPGLRVQLLNVNGEWMERIPAVNMAAVFSVLDCEHSLASDDPQQMNSNLEPFQHQLKFDESLIKVIYRKLENQRDELVISMHHFIYDPFSEVITIKDFMSAFSAFSRGDIPAPIQHEASIPEWVADMMSWANSPKAAASSRYWQSLDMGPYKDIPTDFPYSEATNSIGSEVHVQNKLSSSYTQKLAACTAWCSLQAFDIFITAIIEGFGWWTGNRALSIEISNGRRQALNSDIDLTSTVGFLTDQSPLFIDITQCSSGMDALEHVSKSIRECLDTGIGFNALKYYSEDWVVKERLSSYPEPKFAINYFAPEASGYMKIDNTLSASSASSLSMAGTRIFDGVNRERIHKLGLTIDAREGEFVFAWVFSSNIYKRETIEALSSRCILHVESLVAALEAVDACVGD